MALSSAYLITTKNLEAFFNSLTTAKAPDVFTQKFLENLEFKSTNDRLFIALLKSLGFLDANGTPSERYFRYLDQTQSKRVLAEAVQEAYGDLFAINTKAHELTAAEAKNKFRTLTQGKNSDRVLALMANTFKSLVDYAEWTPEKKASVKKDTNLSASEAMSPNQSDEKMTLENQSSIAERTQTQLHYNIQIHLPDSRDPVVYDAIFNSLKKHLF